jgi:hypothetical protein
MQFKPIIGILALMLSIGSAEAGEEIVVIPSTHAIEDARAYARERAQRAEEARQAMEAWFAKLPPGTTPSDPWVRGQYYDWLRANQKREDETKRLTGLYYVGTLYTEPLFTFNQYDDEGTIAVFLHDSGYCDITQSDLKQFATYMKANRIQHISQLARQLSALLTTFRNQ